jgi:1-acyl-sn-glycerol-3-phosphate acyltransferase
MLLLLIRVALRLFYRRIAYVGLERVPASGPVLFVLNHPNALVDPLFVLDAVRRPVHFLAKAPLFRVPVLGRMLRAAGGLPVFRQQDGADTRLNDETFRECHRVLARRECVAIFPEGTTHSEAVLKPMKTGAARIALGAESVASFGLGLEIVPVGLQYEAKETFRSNVTVWFGEPHRVTDLAGQYAAAPADAVLEQTRRLGVALYDVTLNLDRQDLLDLMAATDIFTGGERVSQSAVIELRRQFTDGYAWLSARVPDRLARLRRALARHVVVLQRLGLESRDLAAGGEPSAAGLLLRALVALPMLALAAVGVIFEWVPYRAVDLVARRGTRGEVEMTATAKWIAALTLYPLWWAASAVAVGYAAGWWAALALLAAHPVVSSLAITALERLERFRRRLQVFRLATRPRRRERLRRHERAIREELQALADLYRSQAAEQAPGRKDADAGEHVGRD